MSEPNYLVVTKQPSYTGTTGQVLPRLITKDPKRVEKEVLSIQQTKRFPEKRITEIIVFRLNPEGTYSLEYYNTRDGVTKMIAFHSSKKENGEWITILNRLSL